jgi:hypothetical protein
MSLVELFLNLLGERRFLRHIAVKPFALGRGEELINIFKMEMKMNCGLSADMFQNQKSTSKIFKLLQGTKNISEKG